MASTSISDLVPGVVVKGPIVPEPIEVIGTMPMGGSVKIMGRGCRTGLFRDPVLPVLQVAQVKVTPKDPPFDGDASRFRLGIEAARLGLAYECDPYFSLSIARIDPLPHQIEAVYDNFLKLPRIRFLLAELVERQEGGDTTPGLAGNIKQASDHLEELNERLERRLRELEMERRCTIGDIQHLGRAWVLPHPKRDTPEMAQMVRDPEIERIAVREAIRHEEARGWQAEGVESENRGFDLISRKPHPEDPKTFIEVRFIEVKGRAGTDLVALSPNEHRTAQRLAGDYWLYVVFDCASTPRLHVIQDPARLVWKPIVDVKQYLIGPHAVAEAAEKTFSGERPA